jgi:hypothetical protein
VSNQKKEVQAYNWLFVGRQRTGKSVSLLTLAATIQYNAFLARVTRRVLIYNPNNYNKLFEHKDNIKEAIRYTYPNWKFPGTLRTVSCKKVQEIADLKDNFFDWTIVNEGTLEEFFNAASLLRDYIIIIDDQNNAIKGNLAGKKYEKFFTIMAGNRVKSLDVMLSYHSFAQVPPSLWTYFQRALVKQTDDEEKFIKRILKAQSELRTALHEVIKQNKITKYPNNLDLSERIVWMNEGYIFKNANGVLVTKIGNVYYQALSDELVKMNEAIPDEEVAIIKEKVKQLKNK